MEASERPLFKKGPDTGPLSLDISPEIAAMHQVYNEIRKLDHMSYERFTTEALVAIANYAEEETPSRYIQRSEINTAKVLNELSIDIHLFDSSDPMYDIVIDAYEIVRGDEIKTRALDTLLKMYMIARMSKLHDDIDITQQLRRIVMRRPPPPRLIAVIDTE